MPIIRMSEAVFDPQRNHVICYLSNVQMLAMFPLWGLIQEWKDLKYDHFRWKSGKKKDRMMGCTRAYAVDINVWCFGVICFAGWVRDVKGVTPLRADALKGGFRALSDFAAEKDAVIHVFNPHTYWVHLPWSVEDCNDYDAEVLALSRNHDVVVHHYISST